MRAKIALICCNYFNIHVSSLANILSLYYDVTVFLYDVNDSNLESNYTFKLINIKPSYLRRLRYRVINAINVRLMGRMTFYPIVDSYYLKRVAYEGSFKLLIGIEKLGLIAASKLVGPKAYYTLELYEKSTSLDSYWFDKIRSLEKNANQKCLFTIVQDEHRWRAISRYNELTDGCDFFLLPVSVMGTASSNASLDEEQINVIHFGKLFRHRKCVEIIEAVLDQTDNRISVLVHGGGHTKEWEKLKELKNDRLVLSDRYIPYNDLDSLFEGKYIGLSIYLYPDENNLLTLFSSERNARYAKAGIPFIILGTSAYQEIYEKCKFFEMIDDLSEINEKIQKIIKEYQKYSLAATQAFERFYSMEKNGERLAKHINKLL